MTTNGKKSINHKHSGPLVGGLYTPNSLQRVICTSNHYSERYLSPSNILLHSEIDRIQEFCIQATLVMKTPTGRRRGRTSRFADLLSKEMREELGIS